MIFPLCKWCFDINWHKFEKRWADVFQIYPNAIHFNPLQFCPSMPLLGFPVFSLSSSIVLNRYFHILVNSMTIWSVLKLPKIAWPSPFKKQFSKTLTQNKRRSNSGKRPNANMLISSFLSIKWHTSCYRTFGEEHLATIKEFTQKILESQLAAVWRSNSLK